MNADRGILATNQSRRLQGDWTGAAAIAPVDFECAYCGNQVASDRGYAMRGMVETYVAICYRCNRPTYFESGRRYPALAPGRPVAGVTQGVADLYDEARNAAGAGSYTAAVMASRKILMNVAVSEGADEGLPFVEYVDYLEAGGFFSPKMRDCIDHIRRTGNEANHVIAPKTEQDAIAAIDFVGALLRHNYEIPGKLAGP